MLCEVLTYKGQLTPEKCKNQGLGYLIGALFVVTDYQCAHPIRFLSPPKTQRHDGPPAALDRGYALITIRSAAARIHAGAPLGPASYGASVLNQNEQRNHCYLSLGTSKNSLAL